MSKTTNYHNFSKFQSISISFEVSYLNSIRTIMSLKTFVETFFELETPKSNFCPIRTFAPLYLTTKASLRTHFLIQFIPPVCLIAAAAKPSRLARAEQQWCFWIIAGSGGNSTRLRRSHVHHQRWQRSSPSSSSWASTASWIGVEDRRRSRPR